MLKRDKECKGICLPRTYKLHSVGIRSPYLGFMWNGCSVSDAGLVHAHESAALGDVTSSLYPFGKSSTSPPSPENFGYVVHHLSLTRTPIRLCCGKRLMSGNPWVSRGGGSLWPGNGNEIGRVADVPVGLCSQNQGTMGHISRNLGSQKFAFCGLSQIIRRNLLRFVIHYASTVSTTLLR